MDPDERRLRDIAGCAQELGHYLEGKDEQDFIQDRMLQRATERLLTIIGEAAKQLSEATRSSIPQPWREMIRFRDKGIHGYDSLSPRTLYRIAVEAVPALRAAIERFLQKSSNRKK